MVLDDFATIGRYLHGDQVPLRTFEQGKLMVRVTQRAIVRVCHSASKPARQPRRK